MKKILLIALAVAVLFCMPLTAMAKADFEMGGYIRMDAIWNTDDNIGHTLAAYPTRNNTGNNHGRFQMNANATRFNFTIKGPEVWGGKVTGFIEVDFDGTMAANQDYFNQARLRLRHAMFKINWPDREVLFGQFWSVNSELIPDTVDSGAYCLYGATQLRIPQVRYTHKFTDEINASLALSAGQNGRWGLNTDPNNPNEGETSETPMVEAEFRYTQDLWGKGAWSGAPRGFYVGLGAAYFRSRSVPLANAGSLTFGKDNFNAFAGAVDRMRYHDHWLFIIENFTPIIPTVSKSLAGTLNLAHQWWIGQGVSAWRLDLPANDRYYVFNGFDVAVRNYDLQFIKRYGGWAQLQYYWTNEIYTNVNFGFSRAFGFSPGNDVNIFNAATNPQAESFLSYAGNQDPIKSAWRASVSQWYRPISAVKFGLQYAYMRADYFQARTIPAGGSFKTRYGDVHSLMANAWYMF